MNIKHTIILYTVIGLLAIGAGYLVYGKIVSDIETARLAATNEKLLEENNFIKARSVSLEKGLNELRKSNNKLADDFQKLTKDVKGIKPVTIIQGGGQGDGTLTIPNPNDDYPDKPGQQINVKVESRTDLIEAQNVNGDLFAKGETFTKVTDAQTGEVLLQTTIPWTDRMTNIFQIQPINVIDDSPKNQITVGIGYGTSNDKSYLASYTRMINTEGRYKFINTVIPDGIGVAVVQVPGDTYAYIIGTWRF